MNEIQKLNVSDDLPAWTKWDEFKYRMEHLFFLRWFKDARSYLRLRFITRSHLINTTLQKGQWWDNDYKILYGMMNLLMEFIEKEKAFEVIVWDSDPDHKQVYEEIINIRNWWVNYQDRLDEIEDQLDLWHNKKFGPDNQIDDHYNWINKLNEPDTIEVKDIFDKLHEMEEQLDKEETDMLIRLVKIRKYLWT